MYNIAKSIFKSPSPPADIGNIWIDTSNSEKPILKAWIKGEWKAISSGGTSVDSYFAVDDNGDLYVKNNKGLYSYSFVSARGKDSSGGTSGGGGSSLSDIWDSLKGNTDAFKNVKINLGHIPDLSISKVLGLQDALDSKLEQSSFSSAQWAAINSTITKEKLQSIEAVTSLFSLDSDGNVYLKDDKGFYTTSFLSTRGKDTSGTSGGGTDLSSVWSSLTTNTDAYKKSLIHIDHIPSLSISKITGLEEALDNNVIEAIKLNQSPLSISNKTVNINAATSLTAPEGLTTSSLTNSGNITLSLTSGYIIPKEERLSSIEEITSLFAKDINGDVYITGNRGLYSNSFISTRGKDDSGTSSGNTDLQSVWESLKTNTDAFKSIQIHQDHIPTLGISKISGLEAALDNNVIEAIKLNQSLLPISSKTVSINAATSLSMPEGLSAGALTNSGNITVSLASGYVIPKEERLLTIEEITSLFAKDANGDVYVTGNKGFYSNSFLSARGKDSSGSTGGGTDLESVWTSLSTATDAFKDVLIDGAHIPSLGIGKIAGLQAALDGKLGTDDLSTAQWAAINSGVTDVMLSGLRTSVSTLESGLAAETARAKAKEDAIAADLTAETDRAKAAEAALSGITDTLSAKLNGIESGAQVNVIESVKLNGTALAVSGKAVNVNAATSIGVPTGLSAGALTSGGKITLSLSSGYTIPKESRLSDIEKITALLALDSDGNVYVTGNRGFYSNAFVSARGKDDSGSSSSGTDLQTVWTSLSTNTDAFKDKKIDINHIPELNISNIKNLVDNLDSKVDKETGKELSSNDYTNTDKTKLAGVETGAEVNKISSINFNGSALSISSKSVSINAVTTITVPTGLTASALSSGGNIAISLSSDYTIPKESRLVDVETSLGNKVDKIDGKGLSTNDFTDDFKTKLTGIESGAEVNKIASIKLNGTTLSISSKSVNVNAATSITVPAAMSSSALSTSGNISLSLKSGYTIPAESRLTAIEKITALFDIDSDGNVYVTGNKGLYSNSFISAKGVDSSGTSGGGANLSEVWESLTSNTDTFKDKKISNEHIPSLSISKITGLQDVIDSKADAIHKHAAGDITSGTLALDRIPTIPYAKTSGVQAALVSGTSIKTINGVSLLGSGDIVTPNTTYSSKAAASGGTDLSLVTTGEKYIWNAKQAAISDLATIRSNATDGATAYGWGDHSKAGYLKRIANLTINGTLYDGTSAVTINTPTYTLSSFGITASATELNYTKGVTSAIQTQLNAKASSSHTHTFASLTSKPTTLAGYGITDAMKAYGATGAVDLNTLTTNGTYYISGTATNIPRSFSEMLCMKNNDTVAQLAIAYTSTGGLYYRGGLVASSGNTWYDWRTVLDSSNYNTYVPTLTGQGASGTWGINISGNAATTTKLATARTIALSGGAVSTPTAFDGSGNVSLPVTSLSADYVAWGDSNLQSDMGPIFSGLCDPLRGNRFAGIPGEDVEIEYSNDAVNYYDYGATDGQKSSFFTQFGETLICGKNTNTTTANNNHRLRVTVTANHVYTKLNKAIIYVSTQSSTNCWVKVTLSNDSTFPNNSSTLVLGTYPINGWPEYNAIPLRDYTASSSGGSHFRYWRFEFGGNFAGNSSGYKGLVVMGIEVYGGVGWTVPNIMAKYGRPYTYDWQGNAKFMGGITASYFSGEASSASKLSTARTIWGQSFDGSGNVDGTLHLKASGNSYTQGIRIYQNGTGYAGILLGSTGLTATTGTDSYSWFISTNSSNNFSISKGGYSTDTTVAFGYNASNWWLKGGNVRMPGNALYLGNSNECTIYMERPSNNYIWANQAGGTLYLGTAAGGVTAPGTAGIGIVGKQVCIGGTTLKYQTLNVQSGISIVGSTNPLIDFRNSSNTTIGYLQAVDAGWMGLGPGSGKGIFIGKDGALTINSTPPTTPTGNSIDAPGAIHSTTGLYSDGFVSARGVDSSSDERLKTDIKPLENALQYVLGTKYRSFRWKEDGKPCIGVIAQEELGREHGYLVEKHKEYYSYNYAATTALIGAALQEEDRKVEALKAKIKKLELEIKQLKFKNN